MIEKTSSLHSIKTAGIKKKFGLFYDVLDVASNVKCALLEQKFDAIAILA